MQYLRYRPDVDGLRAVAVASVVLYHTEVPGFSGGFVGVDVFFVISGYLITSILVRDLSAGTFSIASFYERRLRRIFPALLVVLAFVLVVSPLVLLPTAFSGLGKDVLAALLFVANINSWRNSGYFAPDAGTKPVLHAWSLGVEEQFYLIAPIALWLLFTYARRHFATLVAIALFISLSACVYLTPHMPGASFYMLPMRAWELLAGALLAIRGASGALQAPRPLHNLLGYLGLLLVSVPVFSYSDETVFPGSAAIMPVLGSVLVIQAGPGSLSGRLLSSRPLVWLGLISYSLYLWHWPLGVFFHEAGWLEAPLGKAGAIALSLSAAWLTWLHVEKPARNWMAVPTRKLGACGTVAALSISLVSMVYIAAEGWPSRFSPEVVALDKARDDVSSVRSRCHFDGGLPDVASSCSLGEGEAIVAIWGDSHGVELAQALSESGISVRQITYSACPPILGLSWSRRPNCELHNQQVFEYLRGAGSQSIVILTAFHDPELGARQRELSRGMARTADELRSLGKRVIAIGPMPKLKGRRDLPTWLARGGSRSMHLDVESQEIFRKEMEGHSEIFMPADIFCREGSCNLLPDGGLLLFDYHHPSMHAARLMARALVPLISGRGAGGPGGPGGIIAAFPGKK